MKNNEEMVERLTKTRWADIPNNKLQKIISILDMSDEDLHELFEQYD